MKWTKEQGQAIEERGKNILVSAAAGSGKTAVLVERIKRIIIEDRVALDRMLIVTFSNAAASEMKEKIVKAISLEIELQGEQAQKDRGKLTFLRNQLNLLSKSNISTFHAFSMEVVRRYFHLIDTDPSFMICDDAQKTILQAESIEQLFEELFASDDEQFLFFLKKFSQTKNENKAKEMILAVHEFIQSIPDPLDWLSAQTKVLKATEEDFLAGPVFAEMKKDIERALRKAKSCFQLAGELLEEQQLAGLLAKWKLEMQALDQLGEGMEAGSFDEMMGVWQEVKFQTYTAPKVEKESYEGIKEEVTALRNQGKALIKKISAKYGVRSLGDYREELRQTGDDAAYLAFLVAAFDRIYKEKKEKKGLLDFSDLEHSALRVLRHEEAAEEYRNKFAYLFIDEYQDSNLIQETLINCIRREDNLFMVGDVKQSIYKFRLAEPELFLHKYEDYGADGGTVKLKIDLNRNFRSKGNVIAAVNDVFSQLMEKELSGLDYDEAAALYQGVEYEGELDYPTELYVVDSRKMEEDFLDEELKEMKKAELEAAAAAKIIEEAKGTLIFDAKKGIIRPLTNKDIVVLLRGVKGYGEIYCQALQQAGIPAYVDASDGYFDTLEIEIFLNLLRLIDQRKQDIPLLSVLHSAIFGFSMEELVEIRLRHREGTYYEAFAACAQGSVWTGEPQPEEITGQSTEVGDCPEQSYADELQEKCVQVFRQLKKWKEEASFLSLEDFLWKLLGETGFYEYVGAIPAGVQRQANVRALVDKAVQFQHAQMKGLFRFILYIESLKKRKVPMGQVKLLGENDDVVRVMTIHKSKGLEFPFVLVGGLGKPFNREQGTYQVSFHKDLGLGLRFVDAEAGSYKKTLNQLVIEERRARERMAEEIRILYVAFTRAMDRLVLLGTVQGVEEMLSGRRAKEVDPAGASSYLQMLLPTLPKSNIRLVQQDRGSLSVKSEEKEEARETIRALFSEAGLQQKDQCTGDGELQKEIHRRLSYLYPHGKAQWLKSKFTVTELNDFQREHQGPMLRRSSSADEPVLGKQPHRFTQAERGTFLHKVMEHLNFASMSKMLSAAQDEVEKQQMIDQFIASLVERVILRVEEAQTVDRKKVLAFFASPIGRRAAQAAYLVKEESFNLMKRVEGEKIIIQGTIDCYFEEDGAYILLDYKSGWGTQATDEQGLQVMVDRYRAQLDLYREALEKIRNIEVREVYLYLFDLKRGIQVY